MVGVEFSQGWKTGWKAMAAAENLVAHDPGDPNWPVALAYATRRGVSLKAALRILQEAVLSFPNCAAIHFNLACYHAQLHQPEEANLYLQQACKLDPSFRVTAQTDPDLAVLRQTNLS